MNAQFDAVTTLSTAGRTAGQKPILADGCYVANRFTSPPDAATGVTAGTVAIVEGTDNSVKRHGFRCASNDGIYYPLSEPPNAEYTRASYASGLQEGFYPLFKYGFGPSDGWTIVNADRIGAPAGNNEGSAVRGCYAEFQFTGAPGRRYGLAFQWHLFDDPVDTEIKVLPADHAGGTVYFSKTSFRGYAARQGYHVPWVHYLCQDEDGTPVAISSIKVLIF